MSPATQETSTPGTRRTPVSAAASRAAARPENVSWSVSATTSRPAASAACTTPAGESVPSLAVEWVCRSMRTPASVGGAGPSRPSAGSAQAWGRGAVGQVEGVPVLAQVDQAQAVQQEQVRRLGPGHQPQPEPSGLADPGRPVDGTVRVARAWTRAGSASRRPPAARPADGSPPRGRGRCRPGRRTRRRARRPAPRRRGAARRPRRRAPARCRPRRRLGRRGARRRRTSSRSRTSPAAAATAATRGPG